MTWIPISVCSIRQIESWGFATMYNSKVSVLRKSAPPTIMVKRNKNESIKEQKYIWFFCTIHMDELKYEIWYSFCVILYFYSSLYVRSLSFDSDKQRKRKRKRTPIPYVFRIFALFCRPWQIHIYLCSVHRIDRLLISIRKTTSTWPQIIRIDRYSTLHWWGYDKVSR